MKATILLISLLLCSCSSAPKTADPFDVAIGQALGGIASGFAFPNVGGPQ